MRYAFRLVVVICCAVAGLHTGPAYAKRVALVIGNSEYSVDLYRTQSTMLWP
jgi:hypothetical protein